MTEPRLHLDQILDKVYSWSKKEKFLGYNKHDGLNSPIMSSLLGWAKWPRIIAIQAVMRSPVNIRPILLVPKTINPKGLALFVLGLLDRYKTTNDEVFLLEAEEILTTLLRSTSSGNWSGLCWGYQYPWQDLGFFAPTNTPNAVVSCFVCEAYLEAFRITGKVEYLQIVGKTLPFFLKDLTVLLDTSEHLCLGYMPIPMTMRVMDVSILIGAVLAQYANLTESKETLTTAKRLVAYVVDKQTAYGAWFYTDPPEDSPVQHDNYHSGFILDALWRYMNISEDWQWLKQYEKGLQFYAEELFNVDGSPRWMSNKNYPHDVHGSAQGLVSFSLAVRNGYSYEEVVSKIADWALTNLYHPEGRFFYQELRTYTKKFTLLRWCNAWMFRGMAALCAVNNDKVLNDW
jgi:hypothetical protein